MINIGQYGTSAYPILMYVYEHGKVPITDLTVALNRYPATYYTMVKKLIAAGMLERIIDRNTHANKHILLALTPYGEIVARAYDHAEKEIEAHLNHEPIFCVL